MTEDYQTYASIRTTVEKVQRMIRESALEGSNAHSDLYLNILDDEVQILQSAPGEVLLSYCSFNDSYFDDITLHTDAEKRSEMDRGEEYEYETGAEAIVNVDDALQRLGHASETGKVVMRFQGQDPDKRLCQRLEFDGTLTSWCRLPGSHDILDDVPQWVSLRFDGDEQYTNRDGDAAPTQITVNTQRLQRIIDIVESDASAEFYPIVVEDGSFRVDVGEYTGNGARGTLKAKNTTGPDVENRYYDGFQEIFGVLSGDVRIQTAPGNNPMAVVQEGAGRTIRHIDGPVNI